MIRGLLTTLLLLFTASSVAAQATCEADDLNKLEQLPDLPELVSIVGDASGDWAATALRIEQLRQQTVAEFERTHFAALGELANMLTKVLEGYDGNAVHASALRLADFKPTVCPSDAEGFATCAWEVLQATVQVPFGTDTIWTCENKARFTRYVLAARTLIAHIVDPLVAKAAKDLTRYAAQWKRYVADGFSQYPHEVLLNGELFLDRTAWGPPRHQLIAVHPAVGFGTGDMTNNGQRSAAFVLAVEAVGYVHYWADFRHHVGISAAAVLPNFEWSGVGIAPILHFDGFGVGYGFGLKDAKPDTLFVLLDVTRTMDDYKLAQQAGTWVREQLK